MPKVQPKDFKEGDVINRSEILETHTAIEEVDLDIDQENIREEGLDRRLFKAGQITDTFPTRLFSNNQSTRLSRTSTFKRPIWRSGRLVNSLHSNHPELSFQWDTEKDTHAIIRCSMFVDTIGDDHTDLNDDAWEFGLQIVKPGESYIDGANLGMSEYGTIPMVWPYQRVCLSGAFSGKRHHGFFSDPKSENIKLFGSINFFDESEHPEYSHISSGENESIYPRGAWNQYAMNRSSSWNASVTLIAHVTSNMSNLELGTHHVDQSGEIRIVPVYRCLRLLGDGRPVIKGIDISYQKFRR
tara:strand:- start:1123 stop:2019 length:897 start_codon:yes stop_codon:yes gene_type:complete